MTRPNYIVKGTNGAFTVSPEGTVLEHIAVTPIEPGAEYINIERVDLEERAEFWSEIGLKDRLNSDTIDLLDLGLYYKGGHYEPPTIDWRTALIDHILLTRDYGPYKLIKDQDHASSVLQKLFGVRLVTSTLLKLEANNEEKLKQLENKENGMNTENNKKSNTALKVMVLLFLFASMWVLPALFVTMRYDIELTKKKEPEYVNMTLFTNNMHGVARYIQQHSMAIGDMHKRITTLEKSVATNKPAVKNPAVKED